MDNGPRLTEEGLFGFLVGGTRAAEVDKRHGAHDFSEDSTRDVDDREYSNDTVPFHRRQVETPMSETPFVDPLPGEKMVERGSGVPPEKRIPGVRVGVRAMEDLHVDRLLLVVCSDVGEDGAERGKTLESYLNPSSTRMSRAQMLRFVIEKLGARYPDTGAPARSSRILFAFRVSSRNASCSRSYTRECRYPWHAISWPPRTIRRTTSGFFSPTQPNTKNVAWTFCSSRISRIRSTFPPTRLSKDDHSS